MSEGNSGCCSEEGYFIADLIAERAGLYTTTGGGLAVLTASYGGARSSAALTTHTGGGSLFLKEDTRITIAGMRVRSLSVLSCKHFLPVANDKRSPPLFACAPLAKKRSRCHPRTGRRQTFSVECSRRHRRRRPAAAARASSHCTQPGEVRTYSGGLGFAAPCLATCRV